MSVFVEIYHNDSSITNLQQFVEANFIKLDVQFSLNDLLNYENNAQRIQNAYFVNSNEQATINRLESPVVIRVPAERMQKDIVAASTNSVVLNKSFEVFWGQKIQSLISSVDYKPININNGDRFFKRQNSVSVFCWCKALGTSTDGGLIDLTPFLENVTLNSGKNGANFSIKMSNPKCVFNEKLGWILDPDSNFIFNTNHEKGFFSKQSLNSTNSCLFTNILSTNDVVFIQFETLFTDKKRQQRISKLRRHLSDLFISNDDLKDNNFDLIGLIDNVSSGASSSGDLSFDFSGRDLMKLLIEDGCYFFPQDFATQHGGFINGTKEGGFKRLVSGELSFFNAYVDRTIQYTLGFVFNQLSNIRICSNKLFNFYEQKNTNYKISTLPNGQNDFEQVDSQGIWQAVKILLDEQISNRKIVDSSISTDSGSLLTFVNKVCQEPFVEFFGDTYGDRFYFIARKPPFNQSAILSYLKNNLVIDVHESDVFQQSLMFDDSEVYSWYRLIPRGNFFGDSDGVSFLEFPALYFERYAQIWGSRPLQVVSNYIDYNNREAPNKKINLDFLKKQSVQDLAFVIESNAYLPFSRKGVLTLKGDRRIKRGNLIRLLNTKEVFHVDSVTQNCSLGQTTDRTTVVNMSRGLVEKHLTGQNNYFNIIDLKKDSQGISLSNDFILNDSVFDFFLKRKQFKQ